MTYKINATELDPQPTTGRWISRRVVGEDGNGRPIYSALREFELTWQLTTPAQANALQTFFASVGATGTAVVSLPQYNAATYVFFDYSGTVLREPESGRYFVQNVNDVILLVTKIRT